MLPVRLVLQPWAASMACRLLATTSSHPLLTSTCSGSSLALQPASNKDHYNPSLAALPIQPTLLSTVNHLITTSVTPPASGHHRWRVHLNHQHQIWRELHTQQKSDATTTSTHHTSVPETAPSTPSTATQDSIWTPPNMLSVARAVSGPCIAYLILDGNWPWALAATAISGATDWADGALARRLGQSSVLGSYLDPLADKVLVASVVLALVVRGNAPTWLAVLVVGRDVALVTGMMLHRWRSLGWRTSNLTFAEFFRTDDGSGVPLMQPLMISKLNTVLQLSLVCSCMTNAWVELPDASLLHQLEMLTAGTTAASLGAYMWAYASGRLLPLKVSGK